MVAIWNVYLLKLQNIKWLWDVNLLKLQNIR